MKKINYLFLLFSFTLIYNLNFAQNFAWAKSFGSTTYDNGSAVCTDASGNVINVGSFNGTIDFDPGPGIANLTSTSGTDDIYIVKLNSAGGFIWAKRIGGTGDEVGSDVITDASGNIYTIGSFTGTVDFDPNATTANLTSAGKKDVFVSKWTSAGNYVWAKQMGGANDDWGSAIDLDASANIYATGTFSGNCDFNPSATTNTATVYGAQDAFICKWDVNGTYQWAFSMGGTQDDYGYDVTVNAAGTSVFTTGTFKGTSVDISPQCSCGTVNSLGQSDIFIVKQAASSGGFQNSAVFGGTSYDSPGGITLDALDNVYTTGSFGSACDFDPGPLTVSLGASGSNDGFISKLNSTLGYVFVKQFSGPSSESGSDIVLDPTGNIYVTGSFNDIVDFDPSAASYTVSCVGGTNSDAYVLKLDPIGNFVYVKTWGSSNIGDYSSSIALDASANIYTTGSYWTTCDFDPDAGVFNITSAGVTDAFLHKLSCTMPTTVTSNAANFTLCAGTATSVPINITSTDIGTGYTWSVSGATGVVFSPSTGTTTTMSFTASSTFSVIITGTNACGTVTTQVSKITVNSLPTVTASSSPTAVCSGSLLTLSGSGALTYTWTNGAINNVAFNPPSSQIYTVSGTNVNGCIGTKTINVNVLNNPTVTVTGKNLICLNKANVLNASGANTYLWNPSSLTTNSIIAQPAANTVYTVTGTGANGCTNLGTFSITLVVPQTPALCMVTVDSSSINNEIYWEKTSYTNVDSFIVHREVSTNIYKRIGAVSKNNFSMYVDTNRMIGPANGDPNLTSYKYKLQLRDTCGNYSSLSLYHQTIFIQDQQNGNFNWNSYAVEVSGSPVSNYVLSRRNVLSGITTTVGATTANLLSDPQYTTLATSGNVKWFVDAQGFNCNPTLKITALVQKTRTKSNNSNDKQFPNTSGINESSFSAQSISIYPNPTNSNITIDALALNGLNYNIEIKNLLGQTLLIKTVKNASLNSETVELSSLSKGVYFVNFVHANKIIATKKVIVE
ncbi:MAG: SBBP repeat-containing protein [Bacteroidetes bacterium]|nr:SBBP repeat-containing protein [Bacteroidota bacterium]